MSMAFSDIALLFERLEEIETHDPPFLPAEKAKRVKSVPELWFRSHEQAIHKLDAEGATALLSSLLPERRTDRVYGVQAPSLCRILGRCLSLSASRRRDLEAYKQPGRGDLATCLQRVLIAGGNTALPPVTLGEVDDVLERLASQCRFSDPLITGKLPPGSSEARDQVLGNIFLRARPQEGKWLVRLLLKDFSPVKVNEKLVLRTFHFLLPDLLRFQEPLGAAAKLLKSQLQEFPAHPDERSERLHRQRAAQLLRPEVNVKVGRPTFHKAWSIDYCLKLLGTQRWVLERKYDGEYCEVHVDRNRSLNPVEQIKIFSKSGKDSTQDRRKLLPTLVECLRLGKPDCKIKKQAILLGELVVYSDESQCILPFDKIRKHVSQSGVFLGNEADSQPHAHEHLAVVFFDLLLLDDEVIMTKPVEERRNWLREVYRKLPGRAMSAEWKIVDFADSSRAKKLLMQQFAASVTERCEGLVLKPCGVPYFSLDPNPSGLMRSYIKLKKDYMAGLGDDADFAVVGASYTAQQALKSGVSGVKWTDFHLGCLVNAAEVQRFDARPVFQIVDTIRQEACIPKPVLQALNILGAHSARPYDAASTPANFDVQLTNYAKIDVVFDTPFVLEVLGSGFDKPPNCGFYMLRHARAKKLHQDRSWKQCVSFQELQEQAATARTRPADSESQETRRWLEKMESKLKLRLDREGTTTPRSKRTATPTTVGSAAITASGQTTPPRTTFPSSGNMRTSAMRTQQVQTASSCELDGSTLVEPDDIGNKRLRDRSGETPCPPCKRQCSTDSAKTESSNSKSLESDSRGALPKPKPLADITNQTCGRSPLRREIPEHPQKAKKRQDWYRRLSGLVRDTSTSTARTASNLSSISALEVCANSQCPFANSVTYLAPCLINTPYITEDLFPAHRTTVARDLRHWDRDSRAHPPLTETVSESQAYADMRKIVLVESNRVQAVKEVIQKVVGLNDGRLRERIEVYDWRVLEAYAGHDVGVEAVKGHFIGATMFHEAERRALFVSTIPDFAYEPDSVSL